MKFGVSNLAWRAAREDEAFACLAQAGYQGVEVAPSRVADWAELTRPKLEAYRRKCEAVGLTIPSLQAIFFGHPDAQLLKDESAFDAMRTHVGKIADIGATLGASVAVFGAPRNRTRGEMRREAAFRLAVDRLRWLGDALTPSGVALGVEPVPVYYGADFIEHVDQVVALVGACDHPFVRLHLDCACIQLSGDDLSVAITRYGGGAAHYHAAEPDLGPFSELRCDHKAAAAALRASGYDRWVVIEMREQHENDLTALQQALVRVRELYDNDGTVSPPSRAYGQLDDVKIISAE